MRGKFSLPLLTPPLQAICMAWLCWHFYAAAWQQFGAHEKCIIIAVGRQRQDTGHGTRDTGHILARAVRDEKCMWLVQFVRNFACEIHLEFVNVSHLTICAIIWLTISEIGPGTRFDSDKYQLHKRCDNWYIRNKYDKLWQLLNCLQTQLT